MTFAGGTATKRARCQPQSWAAVLNLELLADRALVEVYRRSEGPGWWYQSYGPADVLRLESLAFALPIGQLYAGITLPEWVEPDELDEDEL
jgi:hypothetical protein